MPRRLLPVVSLVLALAAAPANAQQDGVYEVRGTNLDGSSYTGVAQIQNIGLASLRIRWLVGGQTSEGVGMVSGHTVAVVYGARDRPGLGIYTLKPDGSLEGEWTIAGANARGTETLTPRAATPPQGAPPGSSTPAPAPAPQ